MTLLIGLREARNRLGISKDTLRALVHDGHFTLYAHPTDRRSKMIDTTEIDAYLKPRVIHERTVDERSCRERYASKTN